MTPEQIIESTKKWIVDVVIGCNLCPFAANVVKQQTIFYQVEENTEMDACLDSFVHEMKRLDNNATIETSFLIFPNAFQKFDDYLDLVALAENRLKSKKGTNCY